MVHILIDGGLGHSFLLRNFLQISSKIQSYNSGNVFLPGITMISRYKITKENIMQVHEFQGRCAPTLKFFKRVKFFFLYLYFQANHCNSLWGYIFRIILLYFTEGSQKWSFSVMLCSRLPYSQSKPYRASPGEGAV